MRFVKTYSPIENKLIWVHSDKIFNGEKKFDPVMTLTDEDFDLIYFIRMRAYEQLKASEPK